jgi:hypothetical protein
MKQKEVKAQVCSLEKMDKEIIWNLVNSGLAAGLVFTGGLVSGIVTWETVMASVAAGLIVGINQFKDYWNKEKSEYCDDGINCPKKLGAFLSI